MKSFPLYLLLLLTVMGFTLIAQTDSAPKTNLAICFEMIDSIIVGQVSNIDKSEAKTFSSNLVSDYSIFTNFVSDKFTKLNFSRLEGAPVSSNINFVISKIKVSYSNPKKMSFFGDYSVERNILIEGSFLFTGTKSELISFDKTYSDVIAYNSIKEIEDVSLPFTKGEIPEVPLFSSILEPAIVVGSAAIIVYLFFSVRGK